MNRTARLYLKLSRSKRHAIIIFYYPNLSACTELMNDEPSRAGSNTKKINFAPISSRRLSGTRNKLLVNLSQNGIYLMVICASLIDCASSLQSTSVLMAINDEAARTVNLIPTHIAHQIEKKTIRDKK